MRAAHGPCDDRVLPSPLVGEGGAKRRMRGSLNQCRACGDIPLIRLRFAPAPSPTRGEGEGGAHLSPTSLRAQRSNPAIHAWKTLDCFAALAMTGACRKHNSAFSPRIAPELCNSFRPSIKRAQGMPGAGWHPRSRVQLAQKDAHTSIQVQPEQPGIPCAMGLRLIPCSPWRRIPLASVAGGLKVLRNPVGFRKTSAGLTPATGARTTRLCRPRSRRSSARGLRSQASPPCENFLRARRAAATAPRTQRP